MSSDLHGDSVEPWGVHSGFCVGALGPVVAVVWRGAVTTTAVAEVTAVLERTALASRDPIAFLTVAEFKAPVPPSQVREAIVTCYRGLGPKLACIAHVVEGDGFWACGARCFIAGLGLLARRQQPMDIFGDVDTASIWMRGWLEHPPETNAVTNAVAGLRVAM